MKKDEKKILAYLKERGEPVHVVQLVRFLGLGRRGKTEVRQIMKGLIRQGLACKGRGQTYRVEKAGPELKGKFSLARDGYGFVAVAEGPDVFVPAQDVNGALEGDEVRVNVVREERGRRVGKVEEILGRGIARVVGVLTEGRSGFYIDSPKRGISGRIQVAPGDLAGAKAGESVGVLITQYAGEGDDGFRGKVIKRFDGSNVIAADIETTVFAHGLSDEFPPAVLEEVAGFSDEVREEDLEGRTDLREKPFVTIDGEDARDFDDALCLERVGGGGCRIYVAIADVSHYVQMDTALDSEALDRGTSVYFPTRVLPMLPEKLSNGLCSLRPNEDRLAMTLRIDLDKRGAVKETEVLSTVIRSHARLTYTQVQRLFDGDKGDLPPAPLHEMLFDLKGIADRLFAERLKAGSLDLELPEARLVFDDEQQEIKDIVARSRTRATGLVEELMLLANRLIAARFMEKEFPCVYRVHDEPDPAKVEAFLEVARATLPPGAVSQKMNLHKVQAVIGKQEDVAKQQVLSLFLLRALQRARYSTEGTGHHGLGFDAYLHFTSPIRRYPDLVVHRLLRRHLLGGVHPPQHPEKLQVVLERIASQTSEAEQKAVKAEREVVATLKARFMVRHIGDEFDGLLTAMTGGGFFIRLGKYPVDGFLPVDALPEGQYYFDPDRMMVTADDERKTWRLGDVIRVQLVRSDVETSQLELVLVESDAP